MKVIISNTEIQRYISKHYQKNLTLQTIDKRTIRIGAEVTVDTPMDEQSKFLKMKSLFTKVVARIASQVTLDFTVEKVDGDTVTLRHKGSIGKDLLIQAGIKYIKKSMPQYSEAVEQGEDDLLIIHLNQIPQMKSVLKTTSLDDISFEGDEVMILTSLKQ